MGSALCNGTVFDYKDLVGCKDRRKPVRDKDTGLALYDRIDRILDLLFGNGIKR